MRLSECIRKTAARRPGNDNATQKAADIAQFIPYVGGLASGIIEPATGASRAESGAVQGGMGALGGGLLGIPSAAILMALALKYSGKENRGRNVALAGLTGLGVGGSVGTALGSNLGHWMARRETMTPADWKRLSGSMQKRAAINSFLGIQHAPLKTVEDAEAILADPEANESLKSAAQLFLDKQLQKTADDNFYNTMQSADSGEAKAMMAAQDRDADKRFAGNPEAADYTKSIMNQQRKKYGPAGNPADQMDWQRYQAMKKKKKRKAKVTPNAIPSTLPSYLRGKLKTMPKPKPMPKTAAMNNGSILQRGSTVK